MLVCWQGVKEVCGSGLFCDAGESFSKVHQQVAPVGADPGMRKFLVARGEHPSEM